MAEVRGRFLYEIRPDLFPYQFLTDLEMELWSIWYAVKERERANDNGGNQ